MSFEHISEEVQAEPAIGRPRPPFPVYTWILVGSIAVVFIAQMAVGEVAIEAASFDKQRFLAGEHWRILTGTTIHGGLLHVAMNGYALFSLGRICEMLANRAHLMIVFLLSGIGGGLLSLVFLPDGISVGASGAILGVIGYLAIYAFRRRQFISSEFRKGLLINIGFVLIYGLILSQVIDNFAHVGGLLTGALYGLIQIPSNEYVDPQSAGSITVGAGVVGLVVWLGVCVFSVALLFSFS